MAAVNLSSLPLDYVNADQGPTMSAVAITCFSLAVAAVFLRFLARFLTKASLWWDDWTVLAALVFATGPLSLTLFMVDNGFGKHAEVAGTSAVLIFYKCLYIYEIVYPFPITITKISILLYYKRLFRVQSIRIPIYVVGGLALSWLIYTEASAIFTCTPIRKAWDPTVVGGTCIDIPKFFIGISVPNIFTDLVLLAMPLPYIWGLHVKLPQKIAVMFVFMLGGFIFIVSIIRMTTLLSLGMEDVTWVYVPTCIWTNVEVHIGILTASIPAFWPLLRALATGSVVRKVTHRSHATGAANNNGPSGAPPMSLTPPGNGGASSFVPSFLRRGKATGGGGGISSLSKSRTVRADDDEGFVRLKDISGNDGSLQMPSPAPSRQGRGRDVVQFSDVDLERDGDGVAVAKSGPYVLERPVESSSRSPGRRDGREQRPPAAGVARIQVRSDWTVSSENVMGRERVERSFLR